MSRSGIQYPDVVDLVTQEKDGSVRLILAEVEAITGERVLALQQKLKNYLTLPATDSSSRSTRTRKALWSGYE